MKENSENSYTHILQKSGILKNFSVAKIVSKTDLDELKKLIRTLTSTDEEYEKMLTEELQNLSNMHNPDSPIPGIIYDTDRLKKLKKIEALAKDYSEKMRKSKMIKNELCFLISRIIHNLGLEPDDFRHMNDDGSFDPPQTSTEE